MSERIAQAFAASGKRAALMPYLMGGHPDLETSRACLNAAIEAGGYRVSLKDLALLIGENRGERTVQDTGAALAQ